MNASPIQRYALRLLIATEKIEPLEPREWRILQADSADSYLAPFGGISSAILGIDLKQKTATFSDGDPGTLWMWSLLFPNGLPIDISGKISDTKLYCTLDLTFGTQIIHVTFGKDDFESSIHSTWVGKQTETTNVYTLQGMRVKSNVAKTHALDGLQKGIYIVDGKKVIKE